MITQKEFDHIVERLRTRLPTGRAMTIVEAMDGAYLEFRGEDFRQGYAVGLVLRIWDKPEDGKP